MVHGGSLQDRLARGALPPAEAAALGRGILAGLRAAHAAGIQHRDIKPGNILLRPDGTPVLTDFGIAAIQGATTLTVSGAVIGTPEYMAPERVSGEEGGPAADLWSLALTLYAAVEGHNPMRRGNTLATLAAVLSEEVPPPGRAGPLTEALTAVLVRDPAARPDAGALDRLLAEAGAGAERTGEPGAAGAAGESARAEADSGLAGVSTYVPPPDTATSYMVAPPQPSGPAAPPVNAPQRPPASPVPPPPPGRPGRRVWAYGTAAGAVALTGVLLWALLPDGDGGTPADNARGTASGGTTGGDSDEAGAEQPGSGKKIRIAVKAGAPGLSYQGTDGAFTGFDADTARYLAEALGYGPEDIEWRTVTAAERISMLQAGKVDFTVSTFLMTDDRSRQVDFVGPYLVAHQDVLLRMDDTSIKNAADLNGKAVCSVTGSTPALHLKQTAAPQADIREKSTQAECVDALKAGEVDAFTTDDALLAGYAAQDPGTFRLGGLELSEAPYGIGLPKNSPLKEKLTAALKEMTADGTWAKALKSNLPALRVEPPTVE